jgi:Mrp family chromosome partitioning ATPase
VELHAVRGDAEGAREAREALHIQAAIQKAKRAGIRPKPVEPPVLTARAQAPQPRPQQPASEPERHAPPLDLTSIVYSETRIVDVPKPALEAARIVTGDGEDSITRAYKLLRTQVLHRMQEKGWRTLAVVSPSASEGKTLTAINLGIALAGSVQHTVVLVDCDWRKPSVHKYFNDEPEHDIASYLSNRVPLNKALVNPGIPRFCFLPCRSPISQSSERLGSARVGGFVAELRERYKNRIVMFDLPPMLQTDDCLAFLPHVDCALVVVEENRTKSEDVEQTIELIGRDKILGTVLNKSSVKRAGY